MLIKVTVPEFSLKGLIFGLLDIVSKIYKVHHVVHMKVASKSLAVNQYERTDEQFVLKNYS